VKYVGLAALPATFWLLVATLRVAINGERTLEVADNPIPKGAVVAGMNALKPLVNVCYERYQVPGFVMVNVVINKDGSVRSATITGKFAGTRADDVRPAGPGRSGPEYIHHLRQQRLRGRFLALEDVAAHDGAKAAAFTDGARFVDQRGVILVHGASREYDDPAPIEGRLYDVAHAVRDRSDRDTHAIVDGTRLGLFYIC
jgi:hypothetical protein